jgi:hypothetical protein
MRWACTLVFLTMGCSGPGKGQGEPCTKNSECKGDLFCDNHAGGSNACEYNHDHGPQTTSFPGTDSMTSTTATDGTTGATSDGSSDTSTTG